MSAPRFSRRGFLRGIAGSLPIAAAGAPRALGQMLVSGSGADNDPSQRGIRELHLLAAHLDEQHDFYSRTLGLMVIDEKTDALRWEPARLA